MIHKGRTGFTLVELLVVIAIIGVMVGLLLPAVQAAREAARRMRCSNNLRQIGLGMHNFHSAHDAFPTAVSGSGVSHYWGAQILPYMEQNPLADIYDYSVRFNDIKNREAVQHALSFMLCSSTPGSPLPEPRFKLATAASPEAWGSVGSDYAGNSGPQTSVWNAPSYVSYPRPGNVEGVFSGTTQPGSKGRRIRDITDGTSSSIMFVEASGRPQLWQRGSGRVPGSGELTSAAANYVAVSSWPTGNVFVVRGYREDTTVADVHTRWKHPGPCMVNCSNYYSAFSFHPGGVNVAYADGSVHYKSESISTDVMAQLLTIAGGEIVADH